MIEFVGFILFMYFCPAFRKQVMGQDKLMRRIEQRFAKGIIKYGLIEDGDKVLVGLSGGKRLIGFAGIACSSFAYL